MQNETRTVVPKRSSPKIRESRVPREIDIYLYICWCVSHFRVDHPFFPILLFFPRTKIVSSLSILAPSSVVHFVSITFQIVVPRCQSPEDNLLPHSHLQYICIYRSLKEKSNNRWLSIRSLTITSSFFPVQYDSKPRHSLSVEITGFPRAWHRLLRHRPGLLVSWPIDASTSVVEGTWIQIIPSLLLAKRDGHNPWWVSTKKKKKEKEGGTLLPFQIRGHEKMDRRSTGLELLAPSSRQLGTPRYAFVPLFTTLYSGLRFMRYHRSRPGPFHK